MDPIEEQLRNALRREDPTPGFAGRVRARITAQEEKRSSQRWFWFPKLQWALAILLCIGVVSGILYRREQKERARGEVAKQQVYVALRLAGAKMQLAESKVRHLSE
ncbi:MAG TPA: hypothetical protein VF133_18700 [Terriglobales bacterium]